MDSNSFEHHLEDGDQGNQMPWIQNGPGEPLMNDSRPENEHTDLPTFSSFARPTDAFIQAQQQLGFLYDPPFGLNDGHAAVSTQNQLNLTSDFVQDPFVSNNGGAAASMSTQDQPVLTSDFIGSLPDAAGFFNTTRPLTTMAPRTATEQEMTTRGKSKSRPRGRGRGRARGGRSARGPTRRPSQVQESVDLHAESEAHITGQPGPPSAANPTGNFCLGDITEYFIQVLGLGISIDCQNESGAREKPILRFVNDATKRAARLNGVHIIPTTGFRFRIGFSERGREFYVRPLGEDDEEDEEVDNPQEVNEKPRKKRNQGSSTLTSSKTSSSTPIEHMAPRSQTTTPNAPVANMARGLVNSPSLPGHHPTSTGGLLSRSSHQFSTLTNATAHSYNQAGSNQISSSQGQTMPEQVFRNQPGSTAPPRSFNATAFQSPLQTRGSNNHSVTHQAVRPPSQQATRSSGLMRQQYPLNTSSLQMSSQNGFPGSDGRFQIPDDGLNTKYSDARQTSQFPTRLFGGVSTPQTYVQSPVMLAAPQSSPPMMAGSEIFRQVNTNTGHRNLFGNSTPRLSPIVPDRASIYGTSSSMRVLNQGFTEHPSFGNVNFPLPPTMGARRPCGEPLSNDRPMKQRRLNPQEVTIPFQTPEQGSLQDWFPNTDGLAFLDSQIAAGALQGISPAFPAQTIRQQVDTGPAIEMQPTGHSEPSNSFVDRMPASADPGSSHSQQQPNSAFSASPKTTNVEYVQTDLAIKNYSGPPLMFGFSETLQCGPAYATDFNGVVYKDEKPGPFGVKFIVQDPTTEEWTDHDCNLYFSTIQEAVTFTKANVQSQFWLQYHTLFIVDPIEGNWDYEEYEKWRCLWFLDYSMMHNGLAVSGFIQRMQVRTPSGLPELEMAPISTELRQELERRRAAADNEFNLENNNIVPTYNGTGDVTNGDLPRAELGAGTGTEFETAGEVDMNDDNWSISQEYWAWPDEVPGVDTAETNENIDGAPFTTNIEPINAETNDNVNGASLIPSGEPTSPNETVINTGVDVNPDADMEWQWVPDHELTDHLLNLDMDRVRRYMDTLPWPDYLPRPDYLPPINYNVGEASTNTAAANTNIAQPSTSPQAPTNGSLSSPRIYYTDEQIWEQERAVNHVKGAAWSEAHQIAERVAKRIAARDAPSGSRTNP